MIQVFKNSFPNPSRQPFTSNLSMPRAKVIITDFITKPLDDEQRTLRDLAEVAALDAHGEDELIGRIEDADALMGVSLHSTHRARHRAAHALQDHRALRCGFRQRGSRL